MRIIGQIEHPQIKITVFKTDNRFLIKFELGLYEQTYKFRESEYLRDLKDIEKIVNAAFLGEVMQVFDRMHRTKEKALETLVQLRGEDEFPVIL